MFTIKRSPAKICWHVLINGKFLDTANTKREAIELKDMYEQKYGRLA